MRITPRGGRYKVEVYDPSRPSKKRYVGTFDTKQDAKKEGRAAEDDVAKRRGRKTQNFTVDDWRDRWLYRLQLRVDDPDDKFKGSTRASYEEQTKAFADEHGDREMRSFDVEDALLWLLGDEDTDGRMWTHGGLRTMFAAARKSGVVDDNVFSGLRLRGSRGRKDLEVLTEEEVHQLADCAVKARPDDAVGFTMRALIYVLAFVGLRPAEAYGLRWSDIDLAGDEVYVQRQYVPKTRTFELPKNGLKRRVVLHPIAKRALVGMPRPLDPETLVFRAARGGPMSGRVQHYYWNPIRTLFGNPSMHLYELRHFCGSYYFNTLELPAQDVADQLGHTDGGALVQRLYGHPDSKLARKRIKRAIGASIADVVKIAEPVGSQAV